MIAKIKNFVKRNNKIVLDAIFFILIFFAGFFSGIITGSKIISRPPLIIDKTLLTNLEEETSFKQITPEMAYVASKKGKYYYPLNCPLAQNLKQENRIYFRTKEEAEKQGYVFNDRCLNP